MTKSPKKDQKQSKVQDNQNAKKLTSAQKCELLEVNIKRLIGVVPGFYKVEAKPLFESNYRVNVWTKSYATREGGRSFGMPDEPVCFCPSYKIAYSYFVRFVNGEIVRTSPECVKVG